MTDPLKHTSHVVVVLMGFNMSLGEIYVYF
jgi:hypothetical protein